jgi:NADPH:quinone reductase-like Zn-dependent oxidoreductase
VIDYTRHDVRGSGERYDLIFVAVGNRVGPPSPRDCRGILTADGEYLAVDRGRPTLRAADLVLLKQLAEAGELTPVIDRCYSLAQLPQAHRYVEAGHKKGNVVGRLRRIVRSLLRILRLGSQLESASSVHSTWKR